MACSNREEKKLEAICEREKEEEELGQQKSANAN
jgi:hypothetical protein